jgi:hypothetical protein
LVADIFLHQSCIVVLPIVVVWSDLNPRVGIGVVLARKAVVVVVVVRKMKSPFYAGIFFLQNQ